MSGFTGWRVLVNFLLPPPLVLTFLLVLPLPRNVRKGLLLFTDKVLSLSVLGTFKFVHLALVLSGVPLIDSGFRTYKAAQEAHDHDLTPNQRVGVLARKWREERNWWLSAMVFTLWCLLTVLQAQVRHAMQVHDALDAALAELDELKGISRPTPSGGRSRFSGFGGFGGRHKKDEGGSADAPGAASAGADAATTPGATTRRRVAAAAGGN